MLTGATKEYPNAVLGYVNVKDTALAHVLAFETPSAEGRYLLADRVLHNEELVQLLRNIAPGYPVTSTMAGEAPTLIVNHEKAEKLGINFTSVEDSVAECIASLKERGYLYKL